MNTIILQIAFVIYVVSLASLLYVSFKSKNDLATSFGLVYGIYSLGFLQQVFSFTQFGLTIDVAFTVEDYLRLAWLNTLLLVILLLTGAGKPRRTVNPPHQAIIGILFLLLGLVAMLNEARYYGLRDFVFADKALRFSGGLGTINNLFVITIDYHLFIIAGSYALATVARQQYWRIFFYSLMLFSATLGFFQGYRYYLAALFVFVVLSFAKRRLRFGLVVIASVILLGLFLAEASKITLSWILYYDWVRDYGYSNYFAMSYTGIIPQEVRAIATNTYLGFNVYADQLRPDLLGYLVKLVPFSERFYNFQSFEYLYSILGQDMQLGEGQGTAFSFFLDNYISYFLPVLLLWFVLWLTNVHPAPILKVTVLFFLLNLIRNGFLVSITVLKLPLLIYAVAYLGIALVYSLSRALPPRPVRPITALPPPEAAQKT